jgi:hypothetical protein
MKIVARGTLNRGEAGSNRAVGTFPKLLGLKDGRVLATYKVGPDKDSDQATVELRWSDDLGQSWTEPTTLESPRIGGKRGTLWTAYPTQLSSGRLVMISMWVDRESFPGSKIFHAETEGCLPMTVLWSESDDVGRSWSPWRIIPTPDELGPPSVTSPLMELAGGRLALSVETNKPYLDASRWYQRVVYLYSEDGGRTWSAPHTVSRDPTGRMFNWDQRAGVAPDGRIVTFTWYFDSETGTYLNIRRRISRDEGRNWSDPEDLGFSDQAARPAILPDGRTVLAWVDRFGTQSIRARLAPAIDAAFPAGTEIVLYDHAAVLRGRPSAGVNMADTLDVMSDWSYGLPYATVLSNGEVLIVYYAGTVERMDVEWARLSC